MKSLMRLLQCMLADASIWCRASTTRDFETISRRVEHEGLSFLTITLPTFCKGFEEALAAGFVAPSMFSSFRKHRSLPVLFRGLTELVFDSGTGYLLDIPDSQAIFYIRQITSAYKKIELDCSVRRIEDAYDRYIEIEEDVREADRKRDPDLVYRFGAVSDLLWGSVLQRINLMVAELGHKPKHGPGATADRIVGNDKYKIRHWHERLEPYFPADAFIIPNIGFREHLEEVDFLTPGAETPVRVITVPKTLKTPRIIGIEPLCIQYAQQSLLEILVPVLERVGANASTRITERKGITPFSFVNLFGATSSTCSTSMKTVSTLGFTDQNPNRNFALTSSRTGALATLDLSDASDRVSNNLVLRMLSSVPYLSGAVQACRSTTAIVPGRGKISLAKFASMGSALCFPIEAMVFATCVASGILRAAGSRITRKSIFDALAGVRIYGDDIIVPTEYAQYVIDELEAFGLRVNRQKSFWTGKFRESCGMDAYDGLDITTVKVTQLLPQSHRDAAEMAAAVSLRNRLYKAGMWRSCDYLTRVIERLAPFPHVSETSPILGRHSYLSEYECERSHKDYHAPRNKGMVLVPKPRKSPLEGYGALLKFFLKRSVTPYLDEEHLERYGRPESVDIKIRWASPF